MEAAKELFNANLISEEKTVMEAHQRFIAIRDGQKAYYEQVIAKKEAEKEAALAEKEAALAEKDAALTEKDTIIAELREALERSKA